MMGRTHALTGWCAGAALAPAVGMPSLAGVVVLATATAGYALLPDLDHPGARASRLLGPVTEVVCRVLRAASALAYRLTKGPRDERSAGTHRHLTHTVLFALALGVAAAAGSVAGGRWAVASIAGFGLLLAVDALGDWLLLLAAGGAYGLARHGGALPALHHATGWIGIAVAAGCITHCLGDALTRSGCPFLWPLPIAGETWYEIRPPIRFATGGPFEHAVAVIACAGGVLLMPGAWAQLHNVVTHDRHQDQKATRVLVLAHDTPMIRVYPLRSGCARNDSRHASTQGPRTAPIHSRRHSRICAGGSRCQGRSHPRQYGIGRVGHQIPRRAVDPGRRRNPRGRSFVGFGTAQSQEGHRIATSTGVERLDADTKKPRPLVGASRRNPHPRDTSSTASNQPT